MSKQVLNEQLTLSLFEEVNNEEKPKNSDNIISLMKSIKKIFKFQN